MQLIKIIFISITFLFIVTPNTFAKSEVSEIKTENIKAEKLISKGEYIEAISLLEKSVEIGKFDNHTIFFLGVANSKVKNFDKAIQYFKQALAKAPNQHRIRLELALAYLNNKDLKNSKKEFLTVQKVENLPKNVSFQIERQLKRIEMIESNGFPKNWSVSANIGYMHDSNANAATTEDTVLLFNLPFTLSEDSKEASDNAMKYNLALQHQKIFWDNWQVSSNVGVARTDYQELDNFDLVSLYANTGIYHKRGNVTYGLPLVANRLRVGHEDSYYNYTYGLNPKVTFEFGKKRNIIFDNQVVLQDRKYRTIKARNGNNITYRPNLTYSFDRNRTHIIGIGGYAGRDNAKDDINSNNAYGVSLQYAQPFFNKINIFLSPSFSNTSYKEKENAFDEKRKDKMYSLYSEISYKFKKRKGIQPKLSLNYSYSKNDSNLPLYEYDRQQVGVNLNIGY